MKHLKKYLLGISAGICILGASLSLHGSLTYRGSRASLRLVALGDVLVDRLPGMALAEFGKEEVLGAIRPVLLMGDVVFANLEGPVSSHPRLRTDKDPGLVFCGKPETLASLKWAGINLVSLANNHMGDAGPEGIQKTIQSLDDLGIRHMGAGLNDVQASRPVIMDIKGWRLAALAYSSDFLGMTMAQQGQPGVARAKKSRILADIRRVKRTYNPDFVVVSVHWGNELSPVPNNFQYDLGRACIDVGADVVLGHHPHVLQGLERRGRGLIAYSLGNALFDMSDPEANKSVALSLDLGDTGVLGIQATPFEILPFRCSILPLRGENAQAVLQDLKDRSQGVDF